MSRALVCLVLIHSEFFDLCVCFSFFGLFVSVAVCRLLENAYFVDTMGRYVIKDRKK